MEPNSRRPHPSFRPRLHTGAAAFLVTLLGAPVHATVGSSAIDRDFPIPNTPLASGASVAPNVMVVLADNDQMLKNFIKTTEFNDIKTIPRGSAQPVTTMKPNGSEPFTGSNGAGIYSTPTYNVQGYNPRTTYRPWKKYDGTDYPDMDPASTPSSLNYAVTTSQVDEGMLHRVAIWDVDMKSSNQMLGGEDAKGGWFYAPKDGATELGNLAQYELFKLIGRDEAMRCPAVEEQGEHEWNPAGEKYWPRVESKCESISRFTWTRADGTVIERTLAEEWRNYANWYGYYRTRLKTAKAAISHAFSGLGSGYRVGYNTMMNYGTRRMTFEIPVGSADGRFMDAGGDNPSTNRSDWFDRILSETGGGRGWTNPAPLRLALKRTGDYFMRTDESGPGGPFRGGNQPACRQNYAVVVSDGLWNTNVTEALDETVSGVITGKVGNDDSEKGKEIAGPKGTPPYQYVPVNPYKDKDGANARQTLADVAMHYWKNDLRDDLPNEVPASTGNPAFWQHMVTFTVSISPKGTLGYGDLQALTQGKRFWTNPWAVSTENRNKIDDVFHAAVNGRGMFINAMDPEEVSDGLEAALGAIGQSTGSASSMAFNGSRVDADSRSYVASYVSGEWSGDLRAYAIVNGQVSSTPEWSAAAEGGIPDASARKVFTHGGGQHGRAVPATDFPTAAQQTALTTEVADWIRGDRSREGKGLRVRKVLLGDIAHSSPQYVKTDAAEAVFVGANDGMLHAFHAETGKEMFAYVPGLLDMDGLKRLAMAKGFRHRYHVDGPIAIRKDGGDAVTVVGTLGRGGRGLFGLSADLAAGTASTSWEYTDDEDMGMVLAQPQFVTLSNTRQRGALLVSNGINSASGRAALYVLRADTGKVIRKIQVGDDTDTANGLSAVTALDTDGDGRIDRAYAGDMKGNVWRFNLAGAEGEWTATRVFTTEGYEGRRQPITGSIGVAYHPVSRLPWVFFGTGSYITDLDAIDLRTVHSWYGIEDGDTEVVRGDLIERNAPRFSRQASKDGKTVRVFDRASPMDMAGHRGWVMDLSSSRSSSRPEDQGERMVGEQIIMGGRTLVAASMMTGGSNCGGNGAGFLNAIDAFTGGATSDPFLNIDMNGDGKIDETDRELTGHGEYAGSINMGLGMITNPGILLGPPSPTGEGPPSLVCANGASAATGCITLNGGTWKSRFGRVSWQELQHP